jgi:hypothetical protein
MKLIIELNDADLMRAIEQQVSKAVADLSTEIIRRQVEEILPKKFDRLDVAAAMRGAADRVVKEGLGNEPRVINAKIDTFVAKAARELITAGGIR